MLNLTHSPQQESIRQHTDQANSYSRLASKAQSYYDLALRAGWVRKLWSRISKRSNRLLDLEETARFLKVRGRHDKGMQAVLIRQIIGSEGRVTDFDSSFNPLNEKTRSRWLSIATARLQGTAMPAVELIQVGENYFVRDGHHRISVAHSFGEEAIDAHVIIWDTPAALAAQQPAEATQLCTQAI